MGFVALKCPSCGADIQIDDTREFGFCTYCGTKVVQEKTIIEHRGTISVDGVANENATLDRAFMFVEDGKYNQAVAYFEKVLNLNPRCSKAYFGKLLCQFRCINKSMLASSAAKPLESFDNYVKAKRFATETELAEYEEIEKNILNRVNNKANEYQLSISQANSKISEINQYLDNNKKAFNIAVVKQTLMLILSIVLLVAFIFVFLLLFIGNEGEEQSIGFNIFWFMITCVPTSVGAILCFKSYTKNKKLVEFYSSKQLLLQRNKVELSNLVNNFNNWRKDIAERISDDVF